MNPATLHLFIGLLIFLIALSAFFSAAEIGMMSINRYRLRNLVRKKNYAAKRVQQLLERPDRLLGVILIGNTFSNILASAIATIIAVHYFGDAGVAISTLSLTLIILIFAEITPKTLAALYPQQVAFPSSLLLKLLLYVLYPFVWVANVIANNILRLCGVNINQQRIDTLTHEELHTIVREAGGKNISAYQEILLSVLDMQQITVDDIMIPRNEIVGIDIDRDWEVILEKIVACDHARVPLYHSSIENTVGMLHLRQTLSLLSKNQLTKNKLLKLAHEVHFVPEGTQINIQLINFRQKKYRSGLVVDEYGEILGLITLEDILKEIIGEFTTHITPAAKEMQRQKDGSYLLAGNISIRELKRLMQWQLPTTGPRTLSGLIVEYLEMLPQEGLCLRLAGYPMEIVDVEENKIKTVRIWPQLYQA